jgi:hypothetical protein
MQSRLFHAVVAAGLSLGAASAVVAACSDSGGEERRRADADASTADATPSDAGAATLSDAPAYEASAPDSAPYVPEHDAAVDSDAGWPTTK